MPSSRSPLSRSLCIPNHDLYDEANAIFPDWLMQQEEFQRILASRDTQGQHIENHVEKTPKTEYEAKIIAEFLRKVEFFSKMPKYQLHSVAAKTSLKRLIPGEVLIQQGDIGVEMYVIIRGTVKVYIDGAEISEVGSLNVMGECINDPVRPRSATVIAISHLSCVVITRQDYNETMTQYKFLEQRNTVKYLRTIPLFSNWLSFKVHKIAEFCLVKTYAKGQAIYKPGDDPNAMYIAKRGTVAIEIDVQVDKKNKWPISKKQWEVVETTTRYRKVMRLCKANDIFGSCELLTGQKRIVRAVAQTRATVLIINKQNFFDIFDKADFEALRTQYDPFYDAAEVSVQTARDINKSRDQIKMLCDATDYSDYAEPETRLPLLKRGPAWRSRFVSGIVSDHRTHLRRQIIGKRKKYKIYSSFDKYK